ncbi:ABC transporter ATP-binding protein [Leucobacter tardus]
MPVAIGLAIDTAVTRSSPSLLLFCLAGFILLFTVLIMCYRWFARFGEGAVIDESHALRTELAARVMGPGGLRRRHGELLTIASSDADQSARSIIWLSGLCGAGAALAVSCGVLLSIDLLLGAVLIGTALVVTVALNLLSPLISHRVADQQRTLAEASALATDLVTGLRVLHGLGSQENATERYRAASRSVETAGIRAGTAKSVQLGASVLAGTIVLVVSVAFAGLLALDGSISVGAFVAAVGAAQFISEPLTAIGFYLQIGAAAKTSAARVDAVLSEPPDAAAADAVGSTKTATDSDTALPFRHPIDVPAGAFIGVVADPVEVERIPSALVLPPGARMHVEPHHADLFAGSIADNLALGGAAGDTWPAIDAAGAREFVDAQPAGIDEHVRDRGLSLSGGQRQRLALARALHTDPDVLVLIEPTTAVDAMTEESVAAGIRALRHATDRPARTTVVITSSPVLLAHTDRVVLAVGNDAPVHGSHHHLLAHHDDYRARILG